MEHGAALETLEAIEASVTALAVILRGGGPADHADAAVPVAGGDLLRGEADGWLETLAGVARLNAQVAALRAHAAAGYAGAAQAMAAPEMSGRAQEMAVVAEVACALTVSERTAGALLAESLALTTALPLTLAALGAGKISWQHARIMVDETTSLDPAGAAGLEAHFLDPDAENPSRGCPAGELVPSRFRHKVRTWRERHHQDSIEQRHAKSVKDRRVEYAPDRDAMAWLSAYLPADQAAGIWDRTTTAARALQGPDEPRTLTQLRADLTATWLLSNNNHTTGSTDGSAAGAGTGSMTSGLTGETSGAAKTTEDNESSGGVESRAAGQSSGRGVGVPWPRAQVLITVPVMSLLGTTGEPATLDGYGPIPPSMARALIAEGAESFHRVLTDPRDGAPLEIGRTSYRVTTAQRQWLRLRDGKCPFPGCNNHSQDNEADHLLAWHHGGTTGINNLAQPCPKHHRLRHTTAWTPTQATTNQPPGWTSPTGRHYPSEHPDQEPPHWPTHVPGHRPDEVPVGADPGGVPAGTLAPAGTAKDRSPEL